MTETTLLQVAVNVPLSREFDYLPPETGPLPGIGCRVEVPFGKRKEIGVVLGYGTDTTIPAEKIKRCIRTIDHAPVLSDDDRWLIRFTSSYYHHPIGEVVAAALPGHLRAGKALRPSTIRLVATYIARNHDIEQLARRAPKQAQMLRILLDFGNDGVDGDELNEIFPTWRRIAKGLTAKGLVASIETLADDLDEASAVPQVRGPALNSDQLAALAVLRLSNRFSVSLLDGVTGSGKTEVYLRRIQDILDQGCQALVLVPEIGLTEQLVSRLRERLGVEPALLHSGLTDTARLAAWRASMSGASRLIVGTRSAIFTPMKRPGIIIVDEEHDASFKQQEGLRYSARDLAIAKAKHLDVPIILGSATPTLEMLMHCRNGSYRHLELPARAGSAQAPTYRLVDTVRHATTDGISDPLENAIRTHVDAGGQVLIYLNRRGFAPTLICGSCGHIAGCDRCDSRLTVHAARRQLRCHHCGLTRTLEESCEECGQTVKPLGEGTERLEDALSERFPEAIVKRIDSDSTRKKGAVTAALSDAAMGRADILVGTQMLSKGHHFPLLTLVGIVNADQGLFGTDFRSSERMAQSIVQVAGRAGREERRGEVVVQTAFPDNPFWERLIDHGYPAIAADALEERRQTRWPPFTHLALLRAAARNQKDAYHFLEVARQQIARDASERLRVLGPVDAPMARKADRHRAQLLVQSSDRATLHRVLRDLRHVLEADTASRKVRWSIDVDPIELF